MKMNRKDCAKVSFIENNHTFDKWNKTPLSFESKRNLFPRYY